MEKGTMKKTKSKSRRVFLTGDGAIAEAMRQINPHVVAAYPITPSTQVVETFARFVADGLVDTEFVVTESEHSAMSACVGAAAGGGRVMTVTGSQGLAYMFEVLGVTSGLRLPMVMAIANRALNSPLNIHGDHSDTMAMRDMGWIHLYSENGQEAYDNTVQAFRIAENPNVRTPVLVAIDGFQTSHMVETLTVETDELVKKFIGKYIPSYPMIDIDNPVLYGAADRPDYYMEHKRNQLVGMINAPEVIQQVGKEYGDLTGRYYGLVEEYRMEDAEYAIVVMSATAGSVKDVIEQLREEGVAAGLLKIRAFRPFPADEVAKSLSRTKSVAVLDRCGTGGAQGGPLFLEVRTALYEEKSPPQVINYIFGLGGRDLPLRDIKDVYLRLREIARTGKRGKLVDFLNLRE
ncbi:MAG: pyruvate ferredoxin oxidoreductase [Candidatus Aminicenantes bacterium]|nr:pyruvate ferredoxin oxidoreductase [Candidatus Aminicenantes bacterium]MDH5714005.1 pyruvate ferredoxin oxidoreductase [Candidatus Aminicenantes bacterium]